MMDLQTATLKRLAVQPLVVSVDMGYGHLRAAIPLARELGLRVYAADGPDLSDEAERELWQRTRVFYEWTTRLSQVPFIGPPMRALVEAFTSIPHLHPERDLSAASLGAKGLERLVQKGLGRGLFERLKSSGAPLLTTFYAPAIAADRLGYSEVYCVVTDSDINRVWAPYLPQASGVHYLVPSTRAGRRLMAYGVPRQLINYTGFPLPGELLGGPELPVLKQNLAARLVRLDPQGWFREGHQALVEQQLGPLPRAEEGRPPLLMFAVGGAGAQAGLARLFLPSVASHIQEGRLRVTLVAGVRPEVALAFQQAIERAGLGASVGHGLEIMQAKDHAEYFERFNEMLARADILWTKPSEMTFFAALGIPLICSWPVGVHERYNRRWAIEAGAGLKQRDPRFAGQWLAEWLTDGTLAAAAWAGFTRLPKHGLYRILEAVGARPVTLPPRLPEAHELPPPALTNETFQG
jgi:hypothetical protein